MTVPEIAIRTPLGSDLLGFMVDMSANYDATSHGQNSFTLTETATGRSLTLHGLGFTFHNGALTGGTVL